MNNDLSSAIVILLIKHNYNLATFHVGNLIILTETQAFMQFLRTGMNFTSITCLRFTLCFFHIHFFLVGFDGYTASTSSKSTNSTKLCRKTTCSIQLRFISLTLNSYDVVISFCITRSVGGVKNAFHRTMYFSVVKSQEPDEIQTFKL